MCYVFFELYLTGYITQGIVYCDEERKEKNEKILDKQQITQNENAFTVIFTGARSLPLYKTCLYVVCERDFAKYIELLLTFELHDISCCFP